MGSNKVLRFREKWMVESERKWIEANKALSGCSTVRKFVQELETPETL
jgi:hypothetical protein